MKGYRIVLLVGLLVALVFFYLGLNEWVYSNKQTANPPPIVYKERREEEMRKDIARNIKINEEVRKEKSNIKPKVEKKEKNKEHQKPQKKKLRVIQIGAFSKEKNAKVALKKIANMGYTAIILKEDGFFKVRVKVEDGELKNALTRLKSIFGNVIIIK